jgi:hypothetical protein
LRLLLRCFIINCATLSQEEQISRSYVIESRFIPHADKIRCAMYSYRSWRAIQPGRHFPRYDRAVSRRRRGEAIERRHPQRGIRSPDSSTGNAAFFWTRTPQRARVRK